MAVRYKDTDYMYSSTRVRALEIKLATRETLERMLDANSAADVIAMLGDLGIETVRESDDPSSAVLREQTLTAALASAYDDMQKMTDGRGITEFMRYPYDCNNAKSMIKCASRGIDPRPMLISAGSVSTADTLAAFDQKDYSAFPSHMAGAIEEAKETFAKTSNPQTVDFILDRACFADMLENAKQNGVELAERLVRVKIDLVNIMTCVRILRMRIGHASAGLLAETIIEGGYLDTDMFRRALSSDEAKFSDELKYTDAYYPLSQYIGTTDTLAALERQCDNMWIAVAREAKQVPFGAPVLIGYMAAMEYQIKNIRIILAGKDARLDSETVRERLRDSYV